jgi:ABC-type Fe3+/spermidine/putrescine transport system ATPase subunit
VAEFIGTMNFLDGRVAGGNGSGTQVTSERLGTFVCGPAAAAPGTPVTLAVRPEKITLHAEPPAAEANVLRGRIIATSFMGDRSHHFVAVDGIARPVIVAEQNIARGGPLPSAGEAAWLSWRPEASILLTE